MTASEQTLTINESTQDLESANKKQCYSTCPSIRTCSCNTHRLLEELRVRKQILQSLHEKSQNEISSLKRLDTEHTIYINSLRSQLLEAECSSRRAQLKADEVERKLSESRPHAVVPIRSGLSIPLKNLFAYEKAFKRKEIQDPSPSQTQESANDSSSTLSIASLEEILSQTSFTL